MPLLKQHIVNSNTQVSIWEIDESVENLFANIELREESRLRLSKMKSIEHQKGFLAVRHLLVNAGYSDFDLYYDENGKPFLKDGRFISISHSFQYASIIISTENVGIDIEKKRDKIIRIANKFCNDNELLLVESSTNAIDALTEIWCTKEAMYKMCDSKSLSFKNNMYVDLNANSFVESEAYKRKFRYCNVKIDGFVLVFTLEIK
ncbi:4'-phosphopantetheinyl transferase family protein [Myroides injenensis]|uniref:4'-phosphopantetheinyl transferase family protein n=1 Tax=Myroides injenensis TaxID=1183151 RepID=UPI00028A24C3|nr:4'-phosphopantetheinyl transferase superfamily protein [Myroides injenensis]